MNCGRRSNQTCSGCQRVRYCGTFCQHKDWQRHKADCKPGQSKDDADKRKGEPSPAPVLVTTVDPKLEVSVTCTLANEPEPGWKSV